MAIALPTQPAIQIESEYAATTIIFNRFVKFAPDGTPSIAYNAQVNYQRTDFLVDANGNKTGVVQPTADATHSGYIMLDETSFQADLAADPAMATAFASIAAKADALIHADLVARKILTA